MRSPSGLACSPVPRRGALLAACLLALGLAACAPRLSPAYRDFEVRAAMPAADTLLDARLRRALAASDWSLAPQETPYVLSTEPRDVGGRVRAALDLVPVDGGYVRVYVRASKGRLFGGRGKVYALDERLRRVVLADLSEALEVEGLFPLDAPRERDEEATEG